MSDVPFTFPEIRTGQPVEVSFDNAFAKPALGFIQQCKTNTCSVLVWSRRGDTAFPIIIPDCRHKDDPRVKENPHWLGEEPRGRALFRAALSPNEVTMQKRIAELESRVAKPEGDQLETLASILTDIPYHPQRGRPRKVAKPADTISETVEV